MDFEVLSTPLKPCSLVPIILQAEPSSGSQADKRVRTAALLKSDGVQADLTGVPCASSLLSESLHFNTSF